MKPSNPNKLKKMIIFSSENNRKIIENMILDESTVENRTASSLIENYLLNSLLPKNEDARYWICELYKENYRIGDVFRACFDYLSGGINWEAKHTNALPIVKYAYQLNISRYNVEFSENEKHYFHSLFDSILNQLKYYAEKESGLLKEEILKEENYGRELYDLMERCPELINYSKIYTFIMNNWNFLNNFTKTYRLLSILAQADKCWQDNSNTRIHLVKILKSVSDEWDT